MNNFSPNKIYSFGDLVGQTITSTIVDGRFTTDGGIWDIDIHGDDGDEGNDSTAYIDGIRRWDEFIGCKIDSVDDPDQGGNDGYGCTVTLRSKCGKTVEIELVHDQNGYYGYNYWLTYRRA